VAYAKANPGKLNISLSSIGGVAHLGVLRLNELAGFELNTIPYKGGGPLYQDALAGVTDLSITSLANMMPHVAAGKLKLIGVTGDKRSKLAPNVATLAEQGIKAMPSFSWWGVYAPAGTPKPIVDRMLAEIGKAVRSPDVTQKFVDQFDMEITLPPPDQFSVVEPKPITAAPAAVIDPELTHAFEEAVQLLAEERQRVFEQTASQLAELAAVIARRVIAREISLHPQLVCDLVREGLDALGKHDRVLVRLGSGFESQQALVAQRLADRGSRADVRVEAQLPEHACIVETELGQVDESIEHRLATLLHALRPDSQSAE